MMGNKSLLVIEERKSEAAFVHYDVTSIAIQLPKAGGPSSTNDSNTISDCGRTLQGLSSLRRKTARGTMALTTTCCVWKSRLVDISAPMHFIYHDG